MISPTGRNTVRMDTVGNGRYGAPRGNRKHKGVDFVCRPGDPALAPISGVVTRVAKPYEDEEYLGLVIQGLDMAVKLFYITPDDGIIGRSVIQGQEIGSCQDISRKYGAQCIPHVHVEITSIDPDIFINRIG